MSSLSAPFSWPVAAFATSLPGDFAAVVSQIADLGFRHVDLVAELDRPPEQREALANSGLLVSCMALGRNLPPGHALDASDVSVRRATFALLQRQVIDAAQLGATTAYIVPGLDSCETSLTCFGEGCALLTDYAAARGIRLCVEHAPGRALPTAAATLQWLEQVGHPQLGLLLDVGHCLLSNEDAASVVHRAGAQLAYVHLDDNDGIGDLHWPLFTGRLTTAQLTPTLRALCDIRYAGALCLEYSPAIAEPVVALREGRAILEQMFR
jgi:sugar phosphate isomerase/epimerase